MSAHHNYFGHLAESMTRLLREILKEEGLQLFRKSPQVVFGSPIGSSSDFHLCLLTRKALGDDNGTFTSPGPGDKFLVFRNPTRLAIAFSLQGYGLSPGTRLRAEDRLSTYFFDHPSIEPFLPTSFSSYPTLQQRLMGQRAELKVTDVEAHVSAIDRFTFNFNYLALYHSGNPLREEHRTKQRVIDFGNDLTERSLS